MLAQTNATIKEEMIRPDYWRNLFPTLSINTHFESSPLTFAHTTPQSLALLHERMKTEGYFEERGSFLSAQAPKIANAVKRCVELNISPAFLFLFDELWESFYFIHPIIESFLGEGYRILPDFWVWHVDPKRKESGWRPHRDKGRRSLASDGSPLSLTVWMPLNDATPLNGCIYIVPIDRDPTYNTPEEDQLRIDVTSIRALPATPGSILCWNQAVYHWGSQTSPYAAEPRISMALEFQRGDITPFNKPLLTPRLNMDFNIRLKLVAKQILQYRHMYSVVPEHEKFCREVLQMQL